MKRYYITKKGKVIMVLYRCSYCKKPLMPLYEMLCIMLDKTRREIPRLFYSLCGCVPYKKTQIQSSNSRRPSLDWYDEFYDGYGSYDAARYKSDHMEII